MNYLIHQNEMQKKTERQKKAPHNKISNGSGLI